MLRLRFRRPLVVGVLSFLAWPFPLLALAFLAPVPVIAGAAFLGGAGFAVFDTQWQTTMQRQVPADVLSRVSAYDWFGSLVFLPLGYAIVGPVSSIVGVRAVFFLGSASIVVAVAILAFVPSIRHMQASTEAPGQRL
jgi:MFS family permease